MLKQLNDNNAAILNEVSQLVKQTVTQAKLAQCNNMAKTIALFMDEYNINPSDTAKLIAVDQKSAELLEVLNDRDIALAGIANWMITASIRVLALQEKAQILPADLINAKNRAKEYSDFVEIMKPKVHAGIESRFGSVEDFGIPGAGGIEIPGVSGVLWGYTKDGFIIDNFQTQTEAEEDRDKTINGISSPRLAKMDEAIQDWLGFSNS